MDDADEVEDQSSPAGDLAAAARAHLRAGCPTSWAVIPASWFDRTVAYVIDLVAAAIVGAMGMPLLCGCFAPFQVDTDSEAGGWLLASLWLWCAALYTLAELSPAGGFGKHMGRMRIELAFPHGRPSTSRLGCRWAVKWSPLLSMAAADLIGFFVAWAAYGDTPREAVTSVGRRPLLGEIEAVGGTAALAIVCLQALWPAFDAGRALHDRVTGTTVCTRGRFALPARGFEPVMPPRPRGFEPIVSPPRPDDAPRTTDH